MKKLRILSMAVWTALLTLNTTAAPAVLLNRYSFNDTGSEIAIDSVGGQDGLLLPGAIQSGGSVYLDGNALSYVELPPYLIHSSTITQNAVTLESWASFGYLYTWARLFDFGNTYAPEGSAGNYLFFCPHGPNSDIRLIASSAFPHGWENEDGVIVPGSLDYVDGVYIACVVDFGLNRAAIYINGALAGEDSYFTKNLWDINNVYSFLGKSLYTADPNMIGSIDEFRIYDGALSATNIAANFLDGPDGPAAFSLVSFIPHGTGITNQPVLEALIADGSSEVDPSSILLSLDGIPVAPYISRDSSTTTVSYAVTDVLEPLSAHSVRLVVAGVNPPTDPITNAWTFVVIGSGEPKRVYVDATDGPDGNTRVWDPNTFMFTEWNPPGEIYDEYDQLWEKWEFIANNNSLYVSPTTEDSPRLRTTVSGVENGAYKIYAYVWGTNPEWEMWTIQAALNNAVGNLPVHDATSQGVIEHYLDIDPDDSFHYVSAVYSSSMSWSPFSNDVEIAQDQWRLFEIPLGIMAVTSGELSVYIDNIYLPAIWGISYYDGIGYEPLDVDPDTFVTGGGWIWSPPGALAKRYDPTTGSDDPPAETTIAHWDFADPGAMDGAFMPGNLYREDLDGDGAMDPDDFRISSLDLSGNGNHISALTSTYIKWSADSIQGDFSMVNANDLPAAGTDSQFNPYITGVDVETITPQQWTIEVVFKSDYLAPYCTLVGRNGNFGNAAALYFSTRNSDLAIAYRDVDGVYHELQVAAGFRENTWYRVAAVSDGTTLMLYLDGELIGLLDLTVTGTDTALAQGYGQWTVAHGMWAGNFTDRFYGAIDEIAISDAALSPETFVIQPYVPVEGRANFGFNAKYKKGSTLPAGQAEFQFKVGDMNFHSSDYEWLVITGADAMLKGTGTINHEDGFGFMLTAIDGKLLDNGASDQVRLQIWETATGEVVYDNQADTTLHGENIQIHSR